VNKASDITEFAPGLRALKFSREWVTRPVFAVVLAAVVLAAIFADRPYLEIVVAVSVLTAAREWHRMVGAGRYAFELVATVAVLWLSLTLFAIWPRGYAAELVLAAGVAIVLAVAGLRHSNPLWQAGGVLYLGIPSLSMLAVRDIPPHGAWIIVELFIIVWATDTGALVTGNVIGGPKLAPRLSPNKTWAGTVGGIAAAAAVAAVFIAVLGGRALPAALFGAGLAIVAHLGDLFESSVKRHFHFKDSGSLIPGHGGVLDRIDSTLFAVVAMAVAIFSIHLDPLFGALL
jgi:phosphatidate cytidylyltransferase